MRQLLSKLEASAAASVARAELSPREVRLLGAMVALFFAFLTFGAFGSLTRALTDPRADRSLVYFCFGIVSCFWVGTITLGYWLARWWVHARKGGFPPSIEGDQAQPEVRSSETASGDELPLEWSQRRQLGWRDLLALGSFLFFEAILVLGASSVILGAGFHLDPAQRLSLPRDFPVVACLFAGFAVAGLAGKYLWLWVMARWLSRLEMAPILAYGTPRRLSRFDQRLLERLTRR